MPGRYDRHLARAQHARDEEMRDRELAQKVPIPTSFPVTPCSVDGILHVRLDMGSGAMTPQVGGGVSHFNSKTKTNSLYIVDASREGRCFAYFWEVRKGGAGPAAIASALMHFLLNHNTGRKNLIIWADNTQKGMKCWMMMKLARHLVRTGWFKTVQVKFYIMGHTYMPGYGPDACHNMFLKQAGDSDKAHVHHWLMSAKAVRQGAWEVVHLKAALHRNFNAFLQQWYTKPMNNAFNLQEFHSISVGRSEDRTGKLVDHNCVLWGRHSHYNRRFIYEFSVDKVSQPSPGSVSWDVFDPQWWTPPEPLKKNVFVGLVRSMPVMDARTKTFWVAVLTKMFGHEAFVTELVRAEQKVATADLSSGTDDDYDERVRKRKDRIIKHNALKASVGIAPRGRKATQRIAPDHLVVISADVSSSVPVVSDSAAQHAPPALAQLHSVLAAADTPQTPVQVHHQSASGPPAQRAAAPGVTPLPAKRKRGRPPGSKNKSKKKTS